VTGLGSRHRGWVAVLLGWHGYSKLKTGRIFSRRFQILDIDQNPSSAEQGLIEFDKGLIQNAVQLVSGFPAVFGGL